MTKLAMRRAWFQVHKWIGLILAILIIPLSLSGAALVWYEPLDRVLDPARYAVSGDMVLAPDAYVAAARTVLAPGERIATLAVPDGHGPVVIAATVAGATPRLGPPQRMLVYLDPPTARVLVKAPGNSGIMRTVHILHGSLLVPGVGRTIVGWIGVAMAVSCFTGLWLWWPMSGRFARGLRWRRHRNTDTNLHHLFGFWVALPLFMLSLTGAWIAFPSFFAALVGQSGQRGGPDRAMQARAQPLATPAQSLATVVAHASAVAPGDLRSIAWPTDRTPDWTVTLARGGRSPASVKVADDTGTAVVAPARRDGGVAQLVRRLHDGTGMGPVWQAIIFIGGILPAILAVTGIIMWWRARRWRAAVAARRAG
ncbi:PepSY domain-containing protein [Sphingomonas bacterium]|uniref:PepSY-associated TM helix domain-containing protein n=1 Tax=Sphingomonas bacterium TaxID=1895847 RepID=UPI001576C501|nr:PepSY-associated TM helix domain-containing protein [Sphingomonas bacterium]